MLSHAVREVVLLLLETKACMESISGTNCRPGAAGCRLLLVDAPALLCIVCGRHVCGWEWETELLLLHDSLYKPWRVNR